MTEENKNTTTPKVEKKKEMKCIVIVLIIISIISNVASAWYFSNVNFEKIMANEYSKFGSKENYELANKAQSIQIKQQIGEIKKYVEQNDAANPTTDSINPNPEDTTNTESTELKKLSTEEIASIKKDSYIE